jgi:hypothetical protein
MAKDENKGREHDLLTQRHPALVLLPLVLCIRDFEMQLA